MIIYFLMGALLFALIVFLAFKNLRSSVKPHDSALKQRAIFSANEQLVFTRLKKILPKHTILGHVSFDSLLTTKFHHTRSKYRNMRADFVVLGPQNDVVAIVAVEDYIATKKHKNTMYQDEILKLAGYRVLRFYSLPTFQQLKDEFRFLNGSEIYKQDITSLKKYEFYSEKASSQLKLMN